VARGVPKEDILESAESRNTIEDVTLSYPIVKRHNARRAIVVTSDYQLDRAQYLFRHIYTDVELLFSACPTDKETCDLDLDALKEHERHALNRLKRRGTE
jgi:uncharacterized SAM-binding protein YcdF (DUF218 family)